MVALLKFLAFLNLSSWMDHAPSRVSANAVRPRSPWIGSSFVTNQFQANDCTEKTVLYNLDRPRKHQAIVPTEAMPKRFNVAVRQLARRAIGKGKDRMQPSEGQDTDHNPHPSLLGLPPEIRNQIYEELAFDTTLKVWPVRERKPPQPIGLLLSCRQIRREYRPVLLSSAQVLITIAGYNFSNLVRVLETLRPEDLDSLKLNNQVWILLLIGTVPTRDDHQKLRGWIEYRSNKNIPPYFGPGRAAAKGLRFEYDVKFLNQIRPPRPMARYANGYQMKLDLLRAHSRMYNRLQSGNEDEPPNEELERLREHVGNCIEVFEELHVQRYEQAARSFSVSTMQSIPASLVSNSTASTVTATG